MGAVHGVRELGNIKLNYRRATMMVQADMFAEVESDLLERIRLRRDYVEARMKYYKATEEGCWEYQGISEPAGYGKLSMYVSGLTPRGKNVRAHRLSYAFHNGVDPSDKLVCHTCDNPKCINPNHLFLGTHEDNMRDMREKGRMFFQYGEANPNNKLSSENVKSIVSSIVAGKGNTEIAEGFEVTHYLISNIRNGKAWKDFTASLGYEPAKYIKFKRKKAAEPLE
jgi:hypothetical protein